MTPAKRTESDLAELSRANFVGIDVVAVAGRGQDAHPRDVAHFRRGTTIEGGTAMTEDPVRLVVEVDDPDSPEVQARVRLAALAAASR